MDSDVIVMKYTIRPRFAVPNRGGLNLESRRDTRYALRVGVTFSWKDTNGSMSRGQGLTRDISLRGAYIYSTTCPELETAMRLSIHFPNQPTTVRALRTLSIARVVRRDDKSIVNESGFAVVSRLALVKSSGLKAAADSE